MSDSEQQVEEAKLQQEDSSTTQKGSRGDLFKAKKRPEEPRPPLRLFAPPNPEEREKRRLNYLESTFEDAKKQLCRFWLRGLCMFPPTDCKYAHGISDLIFEPYNNEPIDFDAKIKDYNQKALWIEARPSYTNIYDFQFEIEPKPAIIYSQADIDTNRTIRAGIRQQCQEKSMIDFYRLMQKTYPSDTLFTEAFVEREFNRVGFNKVGFKLKWQFIVNALSNITYEGKAFIPAGTKKPTIILMDYPENIKENFYTKLLGICKNDAKKDGFPLMESSIRKQFYNQTLPSEPALHQIMGVLKTTFREYLDSLGVNADFLAAVQEDLPDEKKLVTDQVFSYDSEMEKVKEKALALLFSKKKNIQNLSGIEDQLIKEFETNIKAFGSYPKFRFFLRSFLLTQKVYTIRTQIKDFALKPEVKVPKNFHPETHCSCPLKQDLSFADSHIELTQDTIDKYADQRVILVNCEQSLVYANMVIKKSDKVGVDLEGALRVGGHVELVQISVLKSQGQAQIFVFDVYYAQQLAENIELYDKMKQVIQGIMQDVKILKIFHDCRNDSLALHSFLDACPKNVFDTAAIHAFRFQIEKYIGLKKDETKVLRLIDEQRQPGLNEILLTYNAVHGINTQKDEMHKKFQEFPMSYFLQRPIREDYLEYAARDVEDLIEVHAEMLTALKQVCKKAFPQMNEAVVLQWISRISKAYVISGLQ